VPVKIKWEVSPAPNGPYRSFQTRGWPIGFLPNGQRVLLSSLDEYVPAKVKAGDHQPVAVSVDVFNEAYGTTKLVTLKKQGATLAEAKAIAADFFERNPQYIKATQ